MNRPANRLTQGLDPDQREALGDLNAVEQFLARDTTAPDAIKAPDTARLLASLQPLLDAESQPDEARHPGFKPSANRILSPLKRLFKTGSHPNPFSGFAFVHSLGFKPQVTRVEADLENSFAARSTKRGLGAEVSNLLHLARAQTSLLEAPFWWSSLLLLLLGVGVGYASGGAAGVIVLFVVFAPLLAAGGVAYLFRPATRGLWDLERISPVQPLELLYARLTLILAFNVGLALVLLPFAWNQAPIWRLLLAWLGPMIGLTGLALYLSVRWHTLAGTLVPLSLWCAMVMLGWQRGVMFMPLLTADPAQPYSTETPFVRILDILWHSNAVLIGAILALAVGLTLYWQAGQWVRRADYS